MASVLPLLTATGWTSPHLAGVTVGGELDVATAPLLDAEVASVCAAGAEMDVNNFLLDLGAVTFLDSAGLRAANRAVRAARERGWRVGIMPPSASGPRHLMILARRHWECLPDANSAPAAAPEA